jgi:hypothetical protein
LGFLLEVGRVVIDQRMVVGFVGGERNGGEYKEGLF